MSLRSLVHKAFSPVQSAARRGMMERSHEFLLHAGRMASWEVRAKTKLRCLQDAEFKIFSQWGEDGIIDWLIERMALPRRLHSFVEFGVQDYKEANTRFLMANRNWRGFIMDGDPQLEAYLKADPFYWQYDLKLKSTFITRENINDLLTEAGFTGEIGLLSVDIDGNDYWVWEAITVAQPVICICEFNAVFGDLHAISVPYDAAFVRTRKHHSNLYFGASVSALKLLAEKKGYTFLGTTLAGNDCIFVRNDYAPVCLAALEEIVACPSRARESRDAEGQLSYVSGQERAMLIGAMPVVMVETGETVTLGSLSPLGSEDWQ